jgi:hypothetical protein
LPCPACSVRSEATRERRASALAAIVSHRAMARKFPVSELPQCTVTSNNLRAVHFPELLSLFS